MKVSESQLGYARIIANTVREPFVVLDKNFRVLAANRSFYNQFQLFREETENRIIYDLGKGKWNIPRLRRLLETIISECESVEDYKIQISFEPTGEKILLINAHRIESEIVENRLILLSIEDVTEHKQAEESLQIERGRLAATLKSIPDELWITDAQGNIIERSEGQIQYSLGKSNWPDVGTALQELELLNPDGTRRAPGNAALPRALRGEITQKVPEMIRNLETGELRWREVSSSPIRDEKGSIIIPIEEREDVIRIAARLFAGEKWVEYENHWITKNGERRFIRWRNSILLDNNKHPVLAIATGIDITDRKRAEDALRDSETSLKRSQEIAHLGSWELDLVANQLIWSDEIYRIFGQRPQEFGATYEAFLEHVHPDDRAAVDAAYTTSVQEGRDSYEIEHRVLLEATGEIRFVHEKCHHIRDASGKIIRSVGMVHDITDRKKVEVELRESQERFAAAFRSVQDALVISDLESGLIIEVNQTWISHWGYSAEQSIGHRSTELGIFTDVADRDRAMQIIRKEGRLADFEILLRKKSGEIRNAILFVEKLMLSQKELMLTIINDVTERKQAEVALQTRTKELEIANRDLESFSYSVSHDLRSPLTVIKGFINILLEEYGSELDEHGRGILNHITDASDKMASIMTDLLNLARISRENMNCYEIDLNPIANSVVDEFRQSEPQRNVQINITDKILAHADPKLMAIAFRNLIENAWKYTGRIPNARIDIGISSNGNKNTIFIKDNGAGFDMNFAHKIFKPFERLHSDSQFAGTGIGLAIVQRIIQRHGGRIWAESEIEKGSTFYFTLDCTA